MIDFIHKIILKNIKPDLTFILTVNIKKAFQRLEKRKKLLSKSTNFYFLNALVLLTFNCALSNPLTMTPFFSPCNTFLFADHWAPRTNAQSFFRRAAALRITGKAKQAISDLVESLRLNPKLTQAMVNLAQLSLAR